MNPVKKLIICLSVNTCVLVIVASFIFALADQGSTYWRYGPNEDFVLISVRINNYRRYFGVLSLIMVIQIARVVVEEIGMPILGFSIYNPDKKIIKDFTKNQLQFFANAMFTVSGLRTLFLTMITITQIDIAVWSLLVSELASVYTIRLLLNEKKFVGKDYVELDSVTVTIAA